MKNTKYNSGVVILLALTFLTLPTLAQNQKADAQAEREKALLNHSEIKKEYLPKEAKPKANAFEASLSDCYFDHSKIPGSVDVKTFDANKTLSTKSFKSYEKVGAYLQVKSCPSPEAMKKALKNGDAPYDKMAAIKRKELLEFVENMEKFQDHSELKKENLPDDSKKAKFNN